MLQNFRKITIKKQRRKGQSTAEYALLISLVVAAVIAMQTYVQRALQARMRDASQYMVTQTNQLGNTAQYEPYYLQSQYDITRTESDIERQTNDVIGGVTRQIIGNRARAKDGFQSSTYNFGLNGI